MWIKNASIFGISPKFIMPLPIPAEHAFAPVTDLSASSSGWSEVFEGALSFVQNKNTLLHFTIEKKVIPASAVKQRVEDRCAEFAKAQGFAVGKKRKAEIKERVIDEMLPTAFTTRTTTKVWIDQEKHRLIIDSVSNSVIDSVMKALCRTFENLGVQDVTWPRAQAITEWLFTEPEGFTLDDAVSVAYPGEHGKTVQFKDADAQGSDVLHHIQNGGASVESVAMTYNSRISFTMTPDMQLRRIKALDVIAETAKDADHFSNDFFLMTSEIRALISDLTGAA